MCSSCFLLKKCINYHCISIAGIVSTNFKTGSDLKELDGKLLIKCIQDIIHTDTKSTATLDIKKEDCSFELTTLYDERKFDPNNSSLHLQNFSMFDKSLIPPDMLDDVLLDVLDNAFGISPKPKLIVSIPLKQEKFSKHLSVASREVEQQQQQQQQQATLTVRDHVADWINFAERYCATCDVSCSVGAPSSKEQNCAKCTDTLKIRCLKCAKCYLSFRAAYKHVKYECQPRFQCSHCNYKASYQHKLDAHLRNKHVAAAAGFEDQDTLLKCTKCDDANRIGIHFLAPVPQAGKKHTPKKDKTRVDLCDKSPIDKEVKVFLKKLSCEEINYYPSIFKKRIQKFSSASMMKLYCLKCKVSVEKIHRLRISQCSVCKELLMYQCKFCDRLYQSHVALNHHLRQNQCKTVRSYCRKNYEYGKSG